MYSKETFNTLLTLSLGLTAFNYFASKNKEKKEKEKKELEAAPVEAVKEKPKDIAFEKRLYRKVDQVSFLDGLFLEYFDKDENERLKNIFKYRAEDYIYSVNTIEKIDTECYVPTKMDSIRSIISNKNRTVKFYDKPCRHVNKDDNIITKYFKFVDYCKAGYDKKEFFRDLECRKIVNMEEGHPYRETDDKELFGEYQNIWGIYYTIRFLLGVIFIVGLFCMIPTTGHFLESIAFTISGSNSKSIWSDLFVMLFFPVVIYYYYKLCRIFV